MTDELATAACEDLATRWLAAEERVRAEPANDTLSDEAARLGEAYEEAIGAASMEDLRLSWEAALRRQADEEIGSRAWADARRVAELLRTEYEAARTGGAKGT